MYIYNSKTRGSGCKSHQVLSISNYLIPSVAILWDKQVPGATLQALPATAPSPPAPGR